MLKTRVWLSGLALGLLASAVLASVMTYAVWRLYPGGIFWNEQGTDWAVVGETLVSWFVPTIPAAVILSVAVLYLVLPKK